MQAQQPTTVFREKREAARTRTCTYTHPRGDEAPGRKRSQRTERGDSVGTSENQAERNGHAWGVRNPQGRASHTRRRQDGREPGAPKSCRKMTSH